jgi:hypothetical protein
LIGISLRYDRCYVSHHAGISSKQEILITHSQFP